MLDNFKHKLPVQLRFKDIDMMGHVNNAVYLTYVELARVKYFEEVVGSTIEWNQQNGMILAHLEIDYRQPILFEDTIAVYTRCSRIGTKSFDLTWVIVKENTSNGNPEIMAEGKAIIVCFNYNANKSVPIPGERRKQIESYEGVKLSPA